MNNNASSPLVTLPVTLREPLHHTPHTITTTQQGIVMLSRRFSLVRTSGPPVWPRERVRPIYGMLLECSLHTITVTLFLTQVLLSWRMQQSNLAIRYKFSSVVVLLNTDRHLCTSFITATQIQQIHQLPFKVRVVSLLKYLILKINHIKKFYCQQSLWYSYLPWTKTKIKINHYAWEMNQINANKPVTQTRYSTDFWLDKCEKKCDLSFRRL